MEKCQAEGLDIKNHMSTLSVGLGETIREWFSEGEHGTTIEESARVDLAKVKTKAKRKRKTKADEGSEATAVAVIEAPAEAEAATETVDVEAEEASASEAEVKAAAKSKKAAPKRKGPQEIAVETVETGERVEPSAEEAAESATAAAAEVQDEPDVAEEPRFIKIQKPSVKPTIMPVETYVPKPAQLQGPNVIRMEHADHVPVPPSRPPRKKSGGGAARTEGPVVANPNELLSGKTPKRGGRKRTLQSSEEEAEQAARGKRGKGRTSRLRGRSEDTVVVGQQWGNRDWQERQERLAQASGTKLHRRERRLAQTEADGSPSMPVLPTKIEAATVKEPVTVKELSSAIGIRSNEIIGKLMGMGVMATINQVIDNDSAETIALEFGVELTIEAKVSLLDRLAEQFDSEVGEDLLQPRPPVVAFLGHVDHGKTSLLDCIRKASVVDGEAGGITQHIGSYLYDDGERQVTLLDTPGHKAFTAMRARGANMTDIAVLVVAADDGIMPQTEEAINHVKAAGVPIVVALNKMDLPNADENRVLGQLAEKELVPTAWGGDVEVVKTSATTGEGISDLVEYLDYVAELKQLKAKTEGPATGWIVESEMTIGQGVVARLLIKSGTLKTGDVVVSGGCFGKVRTISDASSRSLGTAGPAMPAEITGLEGVPTAGDRFFVVESMAKAKELADEQRTQQREMTLASRRLVTLENLFSEIKAGEVKELNVIIKADVQGSVDVLSKSILEMNTSEVAVRTLHAAVGGITENDIVLAEASNAIIIGFQVIADEHAKSLAEKAGVEIRLYRVIYQITDDIKKALEGMLSPRIEEEELGRAEIRQVFKISRYGNIGGCYATEGVIKRAAKIRLIRDQIVIRDNLSIDSLKRIKDDTNEVRSGLEFGLKLVDCDDIKVGDLIEAYEKVKVSRTLDSVE